MLSGHVVSCKVGIESLIFHTEEADRTWPCPLNFSRQVAAQWIMIKSTEIKAHGAKIASNLLPRLLGCLDPCLFRKTGNRTWWGRGLKYLEFFFACGQGNQCHHKAFVGAMNGLTALGFLAPASPRGGWKIRGSAAHTFMLHKFAKRRPRNQP